MLAACAACASEPAPPARGFSAGVDVRPEAKGEVESLGARFLKLESVESGAGTGGYARELSASEREAQQAELSSHIGRFDIVITTAKVPG